MKKFAMFFVLAAFLAFTLAGCASFLPAGGFYVDAKAGIGAGGGDLSYSKTGTAQCISVLALVAIGDASIQTAAKNGGIKRIKYVDYEVRNILGVYGEYKTIVYGD
jgi:hypothetical protein